QGRHRVQWFEMPESLFMALASCVVSISRRNLVMGEKSGLCGSRNAEASTSRSAAIYSLRLSHIRSGITGSPGSMVLSDIQTIEYATARDVRPLPPRKGWIQLKCHSHNAACSSGGSWDPMTPRIE